MVPDPWIIDDQAEVDVDMSSLFSDETISEPSTSDGEFEAHQQRMVSQRTMSGGNGNEAVSGPIPRPSTSDGQNESDSEYWKHGDDDDKVFPKPRAEDLSGISSVNSMNTPGLPGGGCKASGWLEEAKEEWDYTGYMDLIFMLDGGVLFPDDLKQKIRREMSQPKYMARGARNSRCSIWDRIRAVLPNPRVGGPVVEEHELWVFVLRTNADARLFNEFRENPRCLNAMCEIVDSLFDGETFDEEDYDDYLYGRGAAIRHHDPGSMDSNSDDELDDPTEGTALGASGSESNQVDE